MILLTVVLCMGISSCGDDDPAPVKDGLAGTTWKVVSNNGPIDDFTHITFNSDGTIRFSPDGYGYARWTYKDNVLSIVVGEENEADDWLFGTLTINGNRAVYNHYLDSNKDATYDPNSTKERNQMVLEKQ